VALGLISAVNAIAAARARAVNALLDVFQGAINAALAVLQAAITGDWGALLLKVLDAVLSVLGIDPAAFHAMIAQASEAVSTIVNDPGKFVSNMIDVVVGGVQLFADHFGEHLRRGVIGWLTGALGNIQIPNEWTIWTVLDLARQILGLTWDFVRERAARIIGSQNVERLEMMASWVGTLITEGWGGLWNRIQGSLESLRDSVLASIREFVMEKVIMAAITWLASLFNPVGALVKLVMTIWNIYQFVSSQLQRLFGIVQTVVGAIANIAAGVLQPGMLAIEAVLGNLVPVVIDLLMSLLGVTGVAARVREIIQNLRQRIADAVDAMLQRVLQTLSPGRGRGPAAEERAAVEAAAARGGTPGQIGHPVLIDVAQGEDHTLSIDRTGAGGATVMLRSDPRPLGQWLDTLAGQAANLNDPPRRTEAETHIRQVRALLARLDPLADRAASAAPAVQGATGAAGPASATNADVAAIEDQIAPSLRRAFDLVQPAGAAGDVKMDAIEALRAQFSRVHPGRIAGAQSSANAIKAQFAPRGISRLELVGIAGGQVEIKAYASPPQSVTVRFNEVFSDASQQPDQTLFNDIVMTFSGQGRGSETLAVVSVNGGVLGARRNADQHAEQELLSSGEWQQALAQADAVGTPENKADLVLTVNRSPCKAVCSGVLANWLSANGSRHPNVRFIIASSGRYSPPVTKEDMVSQIWTTLLAMGWEPRVPFTVMADLPRARVQALFREVIGPLMREATLRQEEITDQSDLARLAGAGWQLRQLQVVDRVTPAQGALANMLNRLGQDLGTALRVTA